MQAVDDDPIYREIHLKTQMPLNLYLLLIVLLWQKVGVYIYVKPEFDNRILKYGSGCEPNKWHITFTVQEMNNYYL